MYVLLDSDHEPVGIFKTLNAAWAEARKMLEYDVGPEEAEFYLSEWQVVGPLGVQE